VIEDSPLLSPSDYSFRGVQSFPRGEGKEGAEKGKNARRASAPRVNPREKRERLRRSERDARSTIVPIVKTIF
jgi:hypothetical protein